MQETTPVPLGSTIEVIEDFDDRIYRWKPPTGGMLRFLIAGFLALWLCAWTIGFFAAFLQILTSNANAPRLFLVIWLAMWSIGGIFAMLMLYLLIRPPFPESVKLTQDAFHYNSGSVSLIVLFNPLYLLRQSDPTAVFRRIFTGRRRVNIPKNELGNVVLERIGERQRLYFDHGADRIEIGEHLREPEREWLAAVIQSWQRG
jgi:hypothetical protein